MSTYNVDAQKWTSLSILEQMGNIYSEVGRSQSAKKNGDMARCEQATMRAIDLFDTTVSGLIKQKSVRAKEVLRAKDQYLHTIYDNNVTPEEVASLDRYFLQFAVAARLSR